MDVLLDSHLRCLEVCMDDSLLVSPDLLSLVGKICVVCVTFSNFVQHLIRSLSNPNTNNNLSYYSDLEGSNQKDDQAKLFLYDPIYVKSTRLNNKSRSRTMSKCQNVATANVSSQESIFSKVSSLISLFTSDLLWLFLINNLIFTHA